MGNEIFTKPSNSISVINGRSFFRRPFRPYFELRTPLTGYKFSLSNTSDSSSGSYATISTELTFQSENYAIWSDLHDRLEAGDDNNFSYNNLNCDPPDSMDTSFSIEAKGQGHYSAVNLKPMQEMLSLETEEVVNWFTRLLRALAEIEVLQGNALTAPALQMFVMGSVALSLREKVNKMMIKRNKNLFDPIAWSQCLLEFVYTPARRRRDLQQIAARLHGVWRRSNDNLFRPCVNEDVPQNATELWEFVELHEAYLKYYRTPSGFCNVILAQLPEPLGVVVEASLYKKGLITQNGNVKRGINTKNLAKALGHVFENTQNSTGASTNLNEKNNFNTQPVYKTYQTPLRQRILQWEPAEGPKKPMQKPVKINSRTILDELNKNKSISNLSDAYSGSVSLISQPSEKLLFKNMSDRFEKFDTNLNSSNESDDNSFEINSSKENSNNDFWSFEDRNTKDVSLEQQNEDLLKVWESSNVIVEPDDSYLSNCSKNGRDKISNSTSIRTDDTTDGRSNNSHKNGTDAETSSLMHAAFRHTKRSPYQSILATENIIFQVNNYSCTKCGDYKRDQSQKCVHHSSHDVSY